jgi:hypothetical protein
MTSARRSSVWLCALLLQVLGSGCGGRGVPRSPEDVVHAFAAALAEDRLERAYKLLSPAQRESLSYDDFKKKIHTNPSESKALSQALRQVRRVRVQALVELADGRQLMLAQEGSKFGIDEPLSDFYSQASPRDALRSFVAAVEASRWDVLLALMPAADRDQLDAAALEHSLSSRIEELTRLAALLATALDAPIEIVGERATLSYGESFSMRFVRESDGWKVEDPE